MRGRSIFPARHAFLAIISLAQLVRADLVRPWQAFMFWQNLLVAEFAFVQGPGYPLKSAWVSWHARQNGARSCEFSPHLRHKSASRRLFHSLWHFRWMKRPYAKSCPGRHSWWQYAQSVMVQGTPRVSHARSIRHRRNSRAALAFPRRTCTVLRQTAC